MTWHDLILSGTALLTEAGIDSAKHDAEALAAHVLGISRMQLLLRRHDPVSDADAAQCTALFERRASREPLQYIEGTAGFFGLSFDVNPSVLIPRADTESVCRQALDLLPDLPEQTVLDLGTGSGAIAVSLAVIGKAQVTAVDISSKALDTARKNARKHSARIRFFQSDLFESLPPGKFGLIVSNPPYIPRKELPQLQPEVLFEPREALDGGADGYDFYRRIAFALRERLLPGGALVLECGDDQTEQVAAMFSPHFSQTICFRDLSGQPRGVRGKGYLND